MTTDQTESRYFIRIRGRVLGPYSVPQLHALRNRGQFSRAHEISSDRQTWRRAGDIESLFGSAQPAAPPEEPPESGLPVPVPVQAPPATPLAVATRPVWHYAVNGEQAGPVTAIALRDLVAQGAMADDDLVWKEGMPCWMPFCEVPELRTVGPALPAAASRGLALGAHQVFCYACGASTDSRAEVCPKCGVRQGRKSPGSKDRITAALLAFFIGGLGVHHFYLGNTVRGVLYLLFFWTLIPALIAFVDFIILLCMSDEKFAMKYS